MSPASGREDSRERAAILLACALAGACTSTRTLIASSDARESASSDAVASARSTVVETATVRESVATGAVDIRTTIREYEPSPAATPDEPLQGATPRAPDWRPPVRGGGRLLRETVRVEHHEPVLAAREAGTAREARSEAAEHVRAARASEGHHEAAETIARSWGPPAWVWWAVGSLAVLVAGVVVWLRARR